MASFHTCSLPTSACWGDLSDAEILLLTLVKAQSGLDQNYARFADEKAEAQRGCISSWTSVSQLVTEAGLCPRLLTPRLVLFPLHSSGMKSRGCGLVEKGSRPRSPTPGPAEAGKGSDLTLPAPPPTLLPPGCQEATTGEVKNEPLNVL